MTTVASETGSTLSTLYKFGDDVGATLNGLYQFGESLTEAVVEIGLGVLCPQVLDPRTLYTLTGFPLQLSIEAARLTLAGGAPAALEEIANKTEVFLLVAAVPGLIGVPWQPPYPLEELVGRAYALGDFAAVWSIEGLGHVYGDRVWGQGETPQGLLTAPRTRDLPAGSLLMLHAGIGLSMAQHLLRGLPCEPPPAELRRRLTEIIALDRDNSRPGYLGAAFESLGLVTRTFHPTLVSAVDRELRAIAREVVGLFWHGVGRAIYFWPVNFLPGSAWQVFEMARREAPDELARVNAEAGVAWAEMLVNQRQPQILFELVVAPHGDELARGGFVNGIASSTIMRFDTTPEAPFIEEFCRWQPAGASAGARALWDELVRVPCRRALEDYYPVLKREDRLGEIFEFRDLAALTGSPRRGGGARAMTAGAGRSRAVP